MKKFEQLGRSLSRDEMKNVLGGSDAMSLEGGGSNCNVYCGQGAHVNCSTGECKFCVNAGNGQNPTIPGGDKLCAMFPE